MKSYLKALSLLLAVLTAAALGLSALAADDSAVTFQDNRLVVFKPGSAYTSSDLFDGMKGLMPGDVREEYIVVTNNAEEFDYIEVAMQAINHDERDNPISPNVLSELWADSRCASGSEYAYMRDFLAQLSLEVYNLATGSLIYKESPDKLDGLLLPVFLGKLEKGGSLKLKVRLVVSPQLESKYMNRIGEVDWVFSAEGFNYCPETSCPAPPPSSEVPPPPSSEVPPPPSSEVPPPPSSEVPPPPSSEVPPPPSSEVSPPPSSEVPPPPSSVAPPPPSSEAPPQPPYTGDSGAFPYLALLAVSAALTAVLFLSRRGKQED